MSDEPYPFDPGYDLEIRELDLEDVDALAEARVTVGELAGENESWRFGHVIVDEAQDLTPMQWRMIMRRVRGRSLTIVGDLAQRTQSHAAPAAHWEDLLPPELQGSRRQDLTVNYRSPVEIHELAGRVLAAFAPTVTPSTALRSSGARPEFIACADVASALRGVVQSALDRVGGLVAVIGSDAAELAEQAGIEASGDGTGADRLRFLSPVEAKGLEFDAVVLIEPAVLWARPGGPAQLYIALTRATQQLFVLHHQPLPAPLQP